MAENKSLQGRQLPHLHHQVVEEREEREDQRRLSEQAEQRSIGPGCTEGSEGSLATPLGFVDLVQCWARSLVGEALISLCIVAVAVAIVFLTFCFTVYYSLMHRDCPSERPECMLAGL